MYQYKFVHTIPHRPGEAPIGLFMKKNTIPPIVINLQSLQYHPQPHLEVVGFSAELYQYSTAWLAQLVERTTLNRVVVGSIPTLGVC